MGLLGLIPLKWWLYGALALVIVVTIVGVQHELAAGKAAIAQVQQIKTVSAAETKAVAASDAAVVKQDTAAQAKIVTRYRTLKQKVPVYVTKTAPCIPWGTVRLHDAAVEGVDPSSLPLPAGATDDTCSDVAPSAFVDTVLANYEAAQQNAQQLNDLIAAVQGRAAATGGQQPAGDPSIRVHPTGVLGHSDGSANLPPLAVAPADPPM